MIIARFMSIPKGQVLSTEGAGSLHVQQSTAEQVTVLHSPSSLTVTRLRHFYHIHAPLNLRSEAHSAPACQEAHCTASSANTTTMTAPTYALWDAIKEARDSSVYPKGADFWPEGSLRRIITKNHISTELYPPTAQRPFSYVDSELIRFVQENGTKLLAICLMCRIRRTELRQAMHDFRRYGLNDQSLPISQEVLTQCPLWYDGPDVNNFLQHQWKFVAPKFSMGRCLPMPGLSEGTILPFIQLWTVAKGNFGTVYKVRVHSSHFDRDDPIQQVR